MPLRKNRITKADGRYLWYYSWEKAPPSVTSLEAGPAFESEGLELRWHPLLETWVIVAPERQERTFLPPAEYCPLCPTNDPASPTEVPSAEYEIAVFENRFPTLRRDAAPSSGGPYATMPANGAAEVVLYSPEHDGRSGARRAAGSARASGAACRDGAGARRRELARAPWR